MIPKQLWKLRRCLLRDTYITSLFCKRQTMYYKRIIGERSPNHCCLGKAISIKYSEWMSVALVIQHGMCVQLILSSVACLALSQFPTLSNKGTILEILLNIKYLDFLYNYFWNISHSKVNSVRYCHKYT
jgi:hypothetical protein